MEPNLIGRKVNYGPRFNSQSKLPMEPNWLEEKSTMGHDEGIMPCTYNYPINITDKDCSTETMIDIGHFSIIVTDGKCNEIVDATKDE